MKVYRARLRLLEPTIVSDYSGSDFIRHAGSYIPGSTVRGALLTALLREGRLRARVEVEDPQLHFHPMYPVAKGKVARPAHSLIFECKVCGEVVNALSFSELKKREPHFKLPKSCPEGHLFTLEPARGRPCIQHDSRELKLLSEKELPRTVLFSVGINRKVRASELRMIYGYAALTPGVEFEGLIVDRGERLGEIGVKGREEVYVGRGSSRGYGRAELRLQEDRGYVEKRAKEVEKSIAYAKVAFMALSPLFNLQNSKESEDLSLLKTGLNFQLAGLVPLSVFLGSSENESGMNFLVSGSTWASGYSVRGNVPKLKVRAAAPGTLLFYMLSGAGVERLVEIELTGLGLFSLSGFNIAEVTPWMAD